MGLIYPRAEWLAQPKEEEDVGSCVTTPRPFSPLYLVVSSRLDAYVCGKATAPCIQTNKLCLTAWVHANPT